MIRKPRTTELNVDFLVRMTPHITLLLAYLSVNCLLLMCPFSAG